MMHDFGFDAALSKIVSHRIEVMISNPGLEDSMTLKKKVERVFSSSGLVEGRSKYSGSHL